MDMLKKLLKKPLFRAAEAREMGVHPALLSYYSKKGLIRKLDRGIYSGIDDIQQMNFKWADLVLAAYSTPKSVVCLISALSIYDYTDEIPRKHWLAIPHETTAPKKKGCKYIRMRNIDLGLTDIDMDGIKISIFDRERTLVDAFRYLSKEIAIKVLKAALSTENDVKINLIKLRKYSKALRINIDPYILTVTT